MKLLAGLGNPGKRYASSRHNIGFLVIDQLARDHSIAVNLKNFDCLYGKGKVAGVPALLAKPQTYMNLSGTSIARLFDYYKLGNLADVIVIHDDLDLPYATLRLKADGGHGGHKGVLSTMEHLGGTDFIRVRLGIGKPAGKMMTEDYVLGRFSGDEIMDLPYFIDTASRAVADILSGGIDAAMNKYNGKTINYLSKEV